MCPISDPGQSARGSADAAARQERGDGIDSRGRLFLVGIGPGDAQHLTPAARDALAASDVVVGYRPYVDAVAPFVAHARPLASGMRAEVDRANAAVDEALAGATVAVVSSGDAGVYGMASLVFELLGEHPAVDVEVVPGITAALAAAAVLGAPFANDFACVSLSDLLTPLPVIERRIRAAAEGDFALALYNPRSRSRTEPLDRALAILRETRAPETPIGVVRNALREGQEHWLTTLGDLDVERVDMVTILIVGDSTTRVIGDRLVTPRGYPV